MNAQPPTSNQQPFAGVYAGKRVLLTGHTGFKGSWLSHWLLELGAEVYGFSQPPVTNPALFAQLGLQDRLAHDIGDVRDPAAVERSILTVQPDFVFHLAAQPLVRRSYEIPVETFAVNVMGSVHVLDALRRLDKPCAAVMVTTDKCYDNREWLHGYREEDPLGGYDPYSASKGAAEITIAAMRHSYFSAPGSLVKVASARAGNVIGGGDWALDRIVPDCIRSLQAGEPIPVRNKVATRPWQHVLEPLSGYLTLGAALASGPGFSFPGEIYRSAFNFGPGLSSNRTVADLVREILKFWPGEWEDRSDPHAVHEAKLLNLATDKAHHLLGWQPVWDFETTTAYTAGWYVREQQGETAGALCDEQIANYCAAARDKGLPWAG